MLFSVVTITFNNLAGLAITGESVMAQSFTDFEWVVVDGGSTDGTGEYVQSLGVKKLRFLSEPDSGIYDAMNKGIRIAEGRYLIFMNAGDRFSDSEVLHRIGEVVNASAVLDIIYGDSWEYDDNGHMLLKRAKPHHWIWYGMFAHHQAIFFRRNAIREYDVRFRIGADYALVGAAYKDSKKFLRCSFPVCIYERGGLSQTQSHLGIIEYRVIQKEVLKMGYVARTSVELIHRTMGFIRATLPKLYDATIYRRYS